MHFTNKAQPYRLTNKKSVSNLKLFKYFKKFMAKCSLKPQYTSPFLTNLLLPTYFMSNLEYILPSGSDELNTVGSLNPGSMNFNNFSKV